MKYRYSGLYYYCLNLGEYVRKVLEKENKEKIMFYVPDTEKNTFSKNSSIIEKNWHNKYFKPFLFGCDIWHAPFQSGRPIQKYNKRMKVVLTIHDLNVLYEDKSDKERSESLARTQSLINSSDAIVCISNHCRKDVTAHMDVKNKPVYVIHNGTHGMVSVPEKPLAYQPKAPFVFTLGYVNRKKNFHSLLPLLKNPNLELVVAGRLDEPDYIKNMRAFAEQMGVADRLKILGPVSEHDKAWYYKHAEAFAFPSLAEGFGAPVVEAMEFGKPIFLSDRTSLPEIGGDVSFYFSSFEPQHMLNVFDAGMKEYRKNGLSQKIKQRAEQFQWSEKAKAYIDVYRSL